MNVAFRCPQCDQTSSADLTPEMRELACPSCAAKWPVPAGSVTDTVSQCFICPSTELFVRKDFSQSLGVAIVVAGVVASSAFWAWHMPYWTYGVLFTTALIDVVLYLLVGNVLQCYRCHAQYRDVPALSQHGGFDLETHEKYRQQRLRLAEQARSASSTSRG